MSCLTETPFDRIKQEELPDDYRRISQDFWASFAEKLMRTNTDEKGKDMKDETPQETVRPTRQEILELENTEYDYGHDVPRNKDEEY